MKHIISVIVENKPGVLARVAGLFSRRGFNIESLTVGVTEDPTLSRMTIVSTGDDATLEQIIKQLHKLIDTIKVVDLPNDNSVKRELILIKVDINEKTRSEVVQISDIFRAKIVDVGKNSLTIEITGEEGKTEAFINLMNQFGIKELVRTGKVALHRGEKTVM
ncbi:MAG: acetolactate synthase small subunit [Fusobacteria bacterium]|nr:acetolactate synthase small subunit [Fusobacteriota bacterium]